MEDEEKQCIECGEILTDQKRKYDFLCGLCWFDWELERELYE